MANPGNDISIKISLLGKHGVGKSTLLSRYKTDKFEKTIEATIGASFTSIILPLTVGKTSAGTRLQMIKAQIWDTAGMERYKSLVPMYIRDAQVILICFDRPYIEDVKENIKSAREINELGIIILVQTKCDMAPSFDININSGLDRQMNQFAEENGVNFYKTSAKTGENVTKVFEDAIIAGYKSKIDILNMGSFANDSRTASGQNRGETGYRSYQNPNGTYEPEIYSLSAVPNYNQSGYLRRCCQIM